MLESEAGKSNSMVWAPWIAAAVLAAYAGWLATHALPFCSVDDLEFKQAGLELVLSGRFAAPTLEGYYEGLERAFLLIPPLYPLTYAAWVVAFGTTLYSALVFGFVLRFVSAALLYRLARRWNPGLHRAWAALLAVAYGMIPDYLDRPESITIATGLGALLLVSAGDAGRVTWRTLAAGVLCGCGLASQPIVGGVYGIAITGRVVATAPDIRRGLASICALAVISLATLSLIWLPLILKYPSLFMTQFVELFLSNAGPMIERLATDGIPAVLRFRWYAPLALLGIAGTVVGGLAGTAPVASRQRWATTLTVCMAVVLVVLFASGKDPYFVAMLPWLLAAGGARLVAPRSPAAPGSRRFSLRITGLAVAIAVLFSMLPAARLAAYPLTWDAEDHYRPNKNRLRAQIPGGARVMTDSTLWHALAGHAHIYDGYFVRNLRMNDAQYVVSVNNGSGEAGRCMMMTDPEARKILDAEFDRVDSTLISRPNMLAGTPVSRSRWGFRYALFKRKSGEASARD